MKKVWTILAAGLFLVTLTSGSMLAGDRSYEMEHGKSMEGMIYAEHPGGHAEHPTGQSEHPSGHAEHPRKLDHPNGMDHSTHKGDNIHNGVVDGYRLAYHLIDMREKMKAMKAAGHDHGGMDMTHHLMVYVQSPEGKAIETAKVGFLVEGPDGAKQKLMGMGMGGGYGSDVNLTATGVYTIKAKAITDGKKLLDKFTYTVK